MQFFIGMYAYIKYENVAKPQNTQHVISLHSIVVSQCLKILVTDKVVKVHKVSIHVCTVNFVTILVQTWHTEWR